MIDLIETEKSFVRPHIKPGGTAVDFTMGNGNDTLWLCNALGEGGHVYAFDIQQPAVDATRRRLEEARPACAYTLVCDSHANVARYVSEPICAGLFNLGYLPGGDKQITTLRPSTKLAVEAAVGLLAPDGIILIAVYPGHSEGTAEGMMLTEMLSTLDRHTYCVGKFRILNSPTSPFFIFIERK